MTPSKREKYSRERELFDILQGYAYDYNVKYRIYGSVFNKHYFQEQSDIDVIFYSNTPYLTYKKLKKRIPYTKTKAYTYTFLDLHKRDRDTETETATHPHPHTHTQTHPHTQTQTKGQSKKEEYAYKIYFTYRAIPVTILIVPYTHYSEFEETITITNTINTYFSFFLYIIKYLYYKLSIIPTTLYKAIKSLLFNNKLMNRYAFIQSEIENIEL